MNRYKKFTAAYRRSDNIKDDRLVAAAYADREVVINLDNVVSVDEGDPVGFMDAHATLRFRNGLYCPVLEPLEEVKKWVNPKAPTKATEQQGKKAMAELVRFDCVIEEDTEESLNGVDEHKDILSSTGDDGYASVYINPQEVVSVSREYFKDTLYTVLRLKNGMRCFVAESMGVAAGRINAKLGGEGS